MRLQVVCYRRAGGGALALAWRAKAAHPGVASIAVGVDKLIRAMQDNDLVTWRGTAFVLHNAIGNCSTICSALLLAAKQSDSALQFLC